MLFVGIDIVGFCVLSLSMLFRGTSDAFIFRFVFRHPLRYAILLRHLCKSQLWLIVKTSAVCKRYGVALYRFWVKLDKRVILQRFWIIEYRLTFDEVDIYCLIVVVFKLHLLYGLCMIILIGSLV